MTIVNIQYQNSTPFTPHGVIVSTTPLGWEREPQLDVRPPAYQRTAGIAALICGFTLGPLNEPPPPPTPSGASNFFDTAVIEPVPAARQQYETRDLRAIVSVTPQGFRHFFDKVTIQPVGSEKQQWSAFQPQGQIISITQQGWDRFFFDWTTIKPVPAAQQLGTFSPSGATEVEVTRPAHSFFDTVTIRALQANLQSFVSFQPQDQIISITPQGWERFFDWTIQRPPIIAAQQQFKSDIMPVQVVPPAVWGEDFVLDYNAELGPVVMLPY